MLLQAAAFSHAEAHVNQHVLGGDKTEHANDDSLRAEVAAKSGGHLIREPGKATCFPLLRDDGVGQLGGKATLGMLTAVPQAPSSSTQPYLSCASYTTPPTTGYESSTGRPAHCYISPRKCYSPIFDSALHPPSLPPSLPSAARCNMRRGFLRNPPGRTTPTPCSSWPR